MGGGHPGGPGRGPAPSCNARGGSRFPPSEATGHRKLRCVGVLAILMIFGPPLSVSDTLQCVSQTRDPVGSRGILVVGVSSRGVAVQNASCTRRAERAADLDGFASAAGPCSQNPRFRGLGAPWGICWCFCGLSVAPCILKTFYLGQSAARSALRVHEAF